ncbi:MAG: S46 family peptidase [Bacteroidales bacterium]|nr:S46 family peptidase [Bacteroidales bacterium]MBN2755710.1 S46 family peptidase [Bacteroidales bacterium]
MIKKQISILLIFLFLTAPFLRADEGMWIPLLLKKYNIKDMQAKGFKLTAEDIYSINKASMKDAVMIFGGGCTAELISDKGLIITNHHCGFGSIQSHSSVEHDYLTDGFWAMSNAEELSNAGLTVTFLERMEDVTNQVLANVNENMTEAERQKEIAKQIEFIEKNNTENGKFGTKVKPFFYGNEYYLFVTKVYKDVRLVGAPPSTIGKFGGDTDNWMWPRHTGDFSVFRIYADKNNEPADYKEDNVPFTPKKYFPISIKGVQKGDFTMVFGYPGRTQEYLTSYAVKMISETENPHQIAVRQAIINIMSKYMESDPGIRIKYASKYAGVSNYWKKWIGENKGLKKLNAIQKKEDFEKAITLWMKEDESRNKKYGNLLNSYKSIYEELTPYQLTEDYFYEAFYRLDISRLASPYRSLTKLKEDAKQEDIDKTVKAMKDRVEGHFKDYYTPLDKELFVKTLSMYYKNIDKKFHPKEFGVLESKFKTDFQKYADFIYKKSIFTDKARLNDFLNTYNQKKSVKKLENDPFFKLFTSFIDLYVDVLQKPIDDANLKLETLNRTWMQAIMEFKEGQKLYPDANFTLRVTYGQVDDYFPVDGVKYLHYTTLDGIIEKDNPDIYDYKVPEKLKELYKNKDYGQYAEDGKIHVCFTASNHTTGGNSGSPIINGEGQLLGINFDRNWEGTMSDIMYDPNQCRNISIDIRYMLFIIDKYAGAGYLLDEMTIVK